MKKLARLGLLVVVVGTVFIGIATVLVKIILPPEKAKAYVIQQLTARLHRDVTVGSVSVSLLSGLHLSDLKVSEAPTFTKGTFLTSEGLTLRVAIWPLLVKKITIKEFILQKPEVTIIRLADGKTFNYSDLLTPNPTPVASSRATHGLLEIDTADAAFPVADANEGPAFTLLVSNARIISGIVHFRDLSPARSAVEIADWNLRVRNASLSQPFHLQHAARVTAMRVVLETQLTGNVDPGRGSLDIKSGAITTGPTKLAVSGSVQDLKTDRSKIDLKVDLHDLSVATMAPFVSLPPALGIQGPINGQGTLTGEKSALRIDALLDLTNAGVHYGTVFNKPAKTPLSVVFKGLVSDLQNVQVDSCRATLGALNLTVKGDVKGLSNGPRLFDLALNTNSVALRDLAVLAPKLIPPTITAQDMLQVATRVSGSQSQSGFSAVAKDLAIDLGQIHVSGTASLNSHGGPSIMQTALQTNSFPLAQLSRMVIQLAPYNLGGTGALQVHASGDLSAPIVNGTLTLADGVVHYEGSELSGLRAQATFSREDISIPKLTGKLNGGDLLASVVGHHLLTKPDIVTNGSLSLLDLDILLRAAPGAVKQSRRWQWISEAYAAPSPTRTVPINSAGHFTIGKIKHAFYQAQNLTMDWKLADVTPELSQLTGAAEMKQGAGVIENVEQLGAMSKSLRVALMPLLALQKIAKGDVLRKLGVPALERIPFDAIHGKYAFRSGLMDIQTFELLGRDLDLSSTGTVGLAGAQSVNVHMSGHLAKGLVGGTVGQWLQDSSGRVAMAFKVTGTLASPQVTPEFGDTTQKVIRQAGQQILDQLGIGAKKSKDGNSSAPQTDAQPAANPLDELQKRYKNIFH